MSHKLREDAVDQRVIKALGHPLRQRILRVLNERVASPSEVARELDEPLTKVSYHFKILRECGAIELVRTAPARGTLEHFYRASMRPHLDQESWLRLPQSARDALFRQTLDQISVHVGAAASAGGFSDPRTHVTWTTFSLDETAYGELTDLLDELLDAAMKLEAETLKRRTKQASTGEDDDHRTELVLMHFHRPTENSGA